MRYIIIIVLSSILFSAVKAQIYQLKSQSGDLQVYDQARAFAIKDFSKTKLYKMDSVFDITLYDTLHRVSIDTMNKNNYMSRIGKAYPNIIAVSISGFNTKYFLDTTVNLNQQIGIPTQFIEQNGKLFIWRDKHFQLTDSTIRVLDKYHQIGRGGHGDWVKFITGADDSKKAADYYFCRSDLTVYKKKITRIAIGNYEPPNLKCE